MIACQYAAPAALGRYLPPATELHIAAVLLSINETDGRTPDRYIDI